MSHAEDFADFAEEAEKVDRFEPVIVVDHLEIFGLDNVADLFSKSVFVMLDFVKRLEVAFASFFGVANLTGSAANEKEGFVAVADKTRAHHK